MKPTPRLKRLKSISTVALTASFLAIGSIAGQAGEESVHKVLNDLIGNYAKAARSGMSNESIKALFDKDGFADYLDAYPVGELAGGFVWEPGMGATFTGPYSKLEIKAPFTDYLPMAEGAVLNKDKTYRIGFVFHGFNHPWLISLADTAAWEAARHSNIKLEVIDAEFDDNKMGQVIDNWVAQQFDGIVLWPAREAPMGPPVDRAIDAGIPVVSLDRRTASQKISSEVLGNFYANGLQQGLYLKATTDGGNIIYNRKDLGSTADSIRTGAFLEVIGSEAGYNVTGNYHTKSQRTLAFQATADALQAYDDISVVYNTGGEEAMGALDAIREAKRLNSAPGGKKIVILANDDSKEVLKEVADGNVDMVAPYTPLIGDVGIRAVIQHIGAKEGLNDAPPKLIMTPNLPMITAKPMTIEGVKTVTPENWLYAYGPAVK